jgi:hypothetical protein
MEFFPPKDNQPLCLICLQENPDTPPPCHGVNYPLFHKKCLDMAQYHCAASFRCPHCNQQTPCKSAALNENKNKESTEALISVKMDAARHKTQSIMERWLQNRGYWAKGPEYIRVNDSLMQHEEANAILGGVCRTVCHGLATKPSENCYCSHPPPPDHDAIVFRHRDSEAGVETDVILRRTAFIHNRHGSIHTDGFTLSMTRSRYSKRHFRKPVFIEKRRRRT